jgi:hypothetical protein
VAMHLVRRLVVEAGEGAAPAPPATSDPAPAA